MRTTAPGAQGRRGGGHWQCRQMLALQVDNTRTCSCCATLSSSSLMAALSWRKAASSSSR